MSIFKHLIRTPYIHIKDIFIIISFIIIFYLILHHHHSSSTLPPFHTTTTNSTTTQTTLCHLIFSIASSSNTLTNRQDYIRLWYKPNSTRAYIFLDRPPPLFSLYNTTTLPPILISADTSRFPYTFPLNTRYAIRVARVVKQAVDQNDSDVRWFVFGDDDTVFFIENLIQTLSKYDHDQWYYVGASSERYELNVHNSFDMAFGGGGFAISHGLARVLARVLDSCLMRYPHVYGSDIRIFSCLAELGVGLTHESGFHQVDLLESLFGMLSSHPISPLVSLHHFDYVKPIFPNMTRIQALEHLFEVANVDPARILQQSICYDHLNSLTVLVAWGYSIQVFEGNHFLPDLLSLEKTFTSWKFEGHGVNYMFNTRETPKDPCQKPFIFYFRSVISVGTNRIWTDYIRNTIENCPQLILMKALEEIRVSSKKMDIGIEKVKALRRQCCDILPSINKSMSISIRQCKVDELIAMHA